MNIKINGTTWKIQEVSMADPQLLVNGHRCWGTAFYHDRKISIDKTIPDKAGKRITLLHELSHAFLHEHLLKEQETYTEEELCEFVSRYATQIVEIANKYDKISL